MVYKVLLLFVDYVTPMKTSSKLADFTQTQHAVTEGNMYLLFFNKFYSIPFKCHFWNQR
uniref:Uncharacterized protein n=1 Tax=Anguilla anguilla TaxID=7936 RepID=A0A0E9VYI7_ANGAN